MDSVLQSGPEGNVDTLGLFHYNLSYGVVSGGKVIVRGFSTTLFCSAHAF